jgi:hypothetical protein
MNCYQFSTPFTFFGIFLIALATNIDASELENESLLNSTSRVAHKVILGGGSTGEHEYLQLDGQMLLTPNVGIEGEFYFGAGIGGASITLDSRDLFDMSGLDLTLTSGLGVSDQDVDFGAYGKHESSLSQYSGGALLSYLLDSSKSDNSNFKGLGFRYTADGSLSKEERLQIGVEGSNGTEIHIANFKFASGKQWKSEFSSLLNNGVAATLKRERFDDQLDGSQNLDSGWMGELGLHNKLPGTLINYDLDAGYAFDVNEFVYDAAVSAEFMGGRLGGRVADSPLGQQKEMFFTHSCFSFEVFDIDQRNGEDNLGVLLSYSFQCRSKPQGLDRSLATELSERWQNRNVRISQPVYGSGMRAMISATTRPVRADLTNETVELVNPIDSLPRAVINGFPAQLLTGATFTLDGSASTDAEGPIAGYIWQSIGDCSIRGATNEVTATLVVATQAVICGARLTVTDSAGNTGTVQVQGTVDSSLNTAPIAVITGLPATVFASNSFVVSGISSTDAEGPISSYSWTSNGSCSISDSSSEVTATLNIATSALPGDICNLILTVADSEGVTGSAQVQALVAAPLNTPPTAIITGMPATALAASSFNVSGASSNDTEGPISSYNWTANGSCSISGGSSGVNATLNISASALPGDTCTMALKVADSEGLTSSTQEQTVVTVTLNTPPVAVISIINTFTSGSGQQHTLDGSGSSDAEGPIVSYNWSLSGNCAFVSTPSGITTVVLVPTASTSCTASLTVTDQGGLTNTTQQAL